MMHSSPLAPVSPALTRKSEARVDAATDLDAVVVGAGFAGLYALYRLRGLGLSVRLLEEGGGIGGTWYWNRYPGARCDTESLQYSYQFSEELQQEWEWSERYATQPEIERYLNHVADRFDLRRDVTLDTRVERIVLDEGGSGRWIVGTGRGSELAARFCVMATGCLSSPMTPKIDGLESFVGPSCHTARWPAERIDFGGLNVGVLGTGSSAMQVVPILAEEAKHLYVFQRTANYAVPAWNGPLDPDYVHAFKTHYAENRRKAKQLVSGFLCCYNSRSALEVSPEERDREYEDRWLQGGIGYLGAFADLTTNEAANRTAADFVHRKIRAIVKDPETAELLIPNSVIGCKRLCCHADYYATFNRDNVTLVDVKSAPIDRITPHGVVVSGKTFQVDALVLATGFDAMTGALNRIDIRGKGGMRLKDKWEDGPRAYLGVASAGFPNLFLVTGPGSPSVLTNMVPTIEQHVDFIADVIAHMHSHGLAAVDPDVGAEDAWVAYNDEVAHRTLRYDCTSWYLGSNIPGKRRVFMPFVGGLPAYIRKCEEVAAAGYEGFAFTPAG
jgi:cation diffusion facilitator CzcD-associated flavoprotein CzcO